jgi:small subunit ribosomal protein S8
MNTSDPLSDLLNRLRNGMRAGHERVDVPSSRIKEDVVRVLAEEGYIASWRRVEEKGRPLIRVGLKYDGEGVPIVAGLERVSRPAPGSRSFPRPKGS